MNRKVATWLNGSDSGVSSQAIVTFMEGGTPRGMSHPRDPADLGRCIRLLEIAPEYRERLHEMKSVSPEWQRLIDNWDEIEALYRYEAPFGNAPRCHDKMYFLIYQKPYPRRIEHVPLDDPIQEAEAEADRKRQEKQIKERYGGVVPERINDFWSW